MDAARRKILAAQLSDLLFDIVENCRLSIERTAESLELTPSEFKLIRSMKNDAMVRAGELAQRMQLSSSRLTRIMDGLVRKGIVRREVSPGDRRGIEVTLTAKGREMQAALRVAALQMHEAILDSLPDEERESVVLALVKLGRAIRGWREQ